MRTCLVLRLCLMLVLVLNGLGAVHAGLQPPLPAQEAGHVTSLAMDGLADAGCHDEQPAADLPVSPASDRPTSCCADLCLCACTAPAISSDASPLPAGSWAAVEGLARVNHYPSLSPSVLLRPPTA